MTELDERIRHELERLRPSAEGLEPTLRLVDRRRRNRRIAGGGLGLGLTLALVAGLFALPHGGPVPVATASARNSTNPSAIAPTPSPSGPTPSPSGPGAGRSYLATCSVSVRGDLPPDWQRSSVIVGPLAFIGLRAAANDPPADFSGGGIDWKALVVVAPGHRVTVSVPASEAGHLALIYDPSAFRATDGYTLADGEQSVTFQACETNGSTQHAPGMQAGTQFAGGFLVPGPTCVSLDVQPDGGQPTRVRIPLGAGTCG